MNLQTLTEALKAEGISYTENARLSGFTTFQIGGPCPVLIRPGSNAQAATAVKLCGAAGMRRVTIGSGSNLLIPDEGIDAAVILLGSDFSEIAVSESVLRCKAGAKLSKVCRTALDHGLTGLEFAFGIPGSVGGAAYMNAGAYGGEMRDVVTQCGHIDEAGNAGSFAGDALGFDYRKSVYTDQNLLITDVTIALTPGDPAEIRAKMDALYQRRKDKQPLEYPSAGSVFKRPPGNFAGTLIEQCGLKGVSVGGAQVSVKHAGFIVNRGGATFADVLALIALIQKTVKEKTGYSLEREVKILK